MTTTTNQSSDVKPPACDNNFVKS